MTIADMNQDDLDKQAHELVLSKLKEIFHALETLKGPIARDSVNPKMADLCTYLTMRSLQQHQDLMRQESDILRHQIEVQEKQLVILDRMDKQSNKMTWLTVGLFVLTAAMAIEVALQIWISVKSLN